MRNEVIPSFGTNFLRFSTFREPHIGIWRTSRALQVDVVNDRNWAEAHRLCGCVS